MSDPTRRSFLVAASAGAVVAVIGMPPLAEAHGIVEATPAPAPAWIVGTRGEYDWHLFRAFDAATAKLDALEEASGARACFCAEIEDVRRPCEFCRASSKLDIERVSHFDSIESPTSGDWIDAGYGSICERCGEECGGDGSAHNIDGDAVCEECMDLADWDRINPEVAAEMRAELAEEGGTT